MKSFILYLMLVLLSSSLLVAQSDLNNVLKGGELLLSGISILKSKKGTNPTSNVVTSVCVKNKMDSKIIYRLTGKSEQGTDITKELIIQNDSKECYIDLPKGVYSYEVELPNKEIYRKGEYNFDAEVVITIKKE
ncbi:MAG: hypothetical protein CFE24_02125 [Flavobacterium sp. BFFFF2]|nr:MAG: hypothetical protein CFE24_02125 [Flavobacterium sp. BFFFF2]